MTAAPAARPPRHQAASDSARELRQKPAAQSAQRAAAQVLARHTMRVTLPCGIGTVSLPSPDRLAFYGGVTALAALGIVDWPVALAISAGHLLAEDHHHKVLAEFGEALGEA